MNFISTGFIAKNIINFIQEKVWEKVAVKAITKMAPHKVTLQSNRVFNDFTGLSSNIKQISGTYIKDELDNAKNINQNYLVGTSKLVERQIRSKSQKMSDQEPKTPSYPRVSSKRVKTAINIEEKIPIPPSKNNNFFKLTFNQQKQKNESKIDDVMRETKYSDINYNKNLQEARRQSQFMKQQRSAYEKKRFKEMKVFTYDFEGKLVSLGQNKAGNKLKILKMKPDLSHQNRHHSLTESKKASESRVSQIVNKKLIEVQKPHIVSTIKQTRQKDLQLERQKQKQQRLLAFAKRIPTVSALQFFKQQQNKVSMGVTITEMSSRSKITGRTRDKEDKKNLNLIQFKQKVKHVQLFPDKKIKKRQTTSYFRTQGNELQFQVDNNKRIKTQATDHSQKVVTSLSKYVKNRGVILVSNQRLYDQNFIGGRN